MPRGDGTGPWGEGPMTGGGRGFCVVRSGGQSGFGRGGGLGFGRGRGAGRGQGFGRGPGRGRGAGWWSRQSVALSLNNATR